MEILLVEMPHPLYYGLQNHITSSLLGCRMQLSTRQINSWGNSNISKECPVEKKKTFHSYGNKSYFYKEYAVRLGHGGSSELVFCQGSLSQDDYRKLLTRKLRWLLWESSFSKITEKDTMKTTMNLKERSRMTKYLAQRKSMIKKERKD